MSRGPEAGFITSVHNHLPSVSLLHREKMANPYRGGTPDWWYSGQGEGSRDLWIEWKFITVPVRDEIVIDLVGGKNPPISYLQQHWLKGRYKDGRNVLVIVGSKAGGVIFEAGDWALPITAGEFRMELRDRKDLAKWIENQVTGRQSGRK